jgi:chromate transporter
MMTVPLVLVLAATMLYVHFAAVPAVAGALRAMGAVAAGLIAGTALKLAPGLRANPIGWVGCALLAAAAFVLVALVRAPLVWVLVGLGSVGCALAWRRL